MTFSFKQFRAAALLKRLAAGKPVYAVLLSVLFFLAAGEVLCRLWQAAARAYALRGDKGDYFSLYIVGESTAAGVPYDEGIGLSGLIESSFAGHINGRKLKVFRLAMPGHTVYPQAFALEQALRRRNRNSPGAVLIYAGHNNATAETGIPGFEYLREKVLSGSVLFDYLGFYAEKYFPFFRVRTLDTYEHFLTRIVELSLENGLTPVVSTVVSNMADMDPGLRPEPGQAGAEEHAVLSEGLRLEAGGREREALRYYSAQARAHPRLRAYLEYRAGKCCQALRRYADAEKYYREVVDLAADDNFGRATSRQNDSIRRLAKRRSIPLVDAEELFKERSPHGLIGNSLFSDGHHPNMAGYLILADAFARRISETFNEPVRSSFAAPADVFRAFSCGKACQAKALLYSGVWLFNSAADHAYPRGRLEMARASLQDSIRLDQHDLSAWLSLGLTNAALDGDLFSDANNLDWAARNGLFTYGEYALSPAKLRKILAKLSACGVPGPLIDRISAEAEKEFAAAAPGRGNSPPAQAASAGKRPARIRCAQRGSPIWPSIGSGREIFGRRRDFCCGRWRPTGTTRKRLSICAAC